MTKKDFELVAEVLRSSKSITMEWSDVVVAFAKRFALVNPRFNKELFFEACGYVDVNKPDPYAKYRG